MDICCYFSERGERCQVSTSFVVMKNKFTLHSRKAINSFTTVLMLLISEMYNPFLPTYMYNVL